MDLSLSEEQRNFQESVRRFARERLAERYAADDRRGEIDPRTRAEMGELGLTGIVIPERYGGQGADAVTTGIAAEELSAADFNAAYLLLIPMLAAEVILAAGDERQRERLLPPIADGSTLPCFCLTEPEHGSDAARLSVRAQRDGAGWRLSGEKTSISLGMAADTAVVFARTSEDGARGISAFYVDLDERYVQRSPFADLGSRAIGRAALHFDDLPVAAEGLLGAPGEGFVRCMQSFELSRAVIGLMCLACAGAGLDEALAYAR
jgi:cyclohexanecarboxyl-CoA dehydrogenase